MNEINQISFNNPNLLNRGTWYPKPPEATPENAFPFAHETPYLMCIGKAHLIFRWMFSYCSPNNGGSQIGFEVLLKHNLNFPLYEEIIEVFKKSFNFRENVIRYV